MSADSKRLRMSFECENEFGEASGTPLLQISKDFLSVQEKQPPASWQIFMTHREIQVQFFSADEAKNLI